MHILFSVQSEYCSLGGHLLKSKTEDGVQGGSFSLSLPLCSITCSKYETTVASHPSLKPHRSWTLFFFSPSVQLVRQASVVFLSLCKYQGWSLRAAVYEDDVGVMCVECGGWRVKEEEEEWR